MPEAWKDIKAWIIKHIGDPMTSTAKWLIEGDKQKPNARVCPQCYVVVSLIEPRCPMCHWVFDNDPTPNKVGEATGSVGGACSELQVRFDKEG